MRLLRFSGYVFIILLLATALVMGMGSRLPVEHAATATAEIPAPPERVWKLISDVQAQPGWRTGLKAVEILPAGEAGPCWREIEVWMAIPLCVVESEAPDRGRGEGRGGRRVVRISDPKLPFGGEWIYSVEAAGPGATGSRTTRVTITERGTTGPAMWRFVGHYVMGEDRQVKQYLRDLNVAAEDSALQRPG